MSRRLAITHAAGPLAEALLEQLQESGVAPDSLVLLDREEQLGKRISYGGTHIALEDQQDFDFEDLAGVLLLEPDAELADLLQHADCPVISHLPLDPQAPLFLGDDEDDLPVKGLVKLPAADLATIRPAVKALLELAGLDALHLVSVLSAMHYGKAGVDDLAAQTIGLLNSRDINTGVFPQALAFNLIPLPANDLAEFHRLVGDQAVKLGHQQLLAPAFHGMALALSLTLKEDCLLETVKKTLAEAGYGFSDEAVSLRSHCQQGADSWVSQLQQSDEDRRRFQFWVVADTVRNGWPRLYREAVQKLLDRG